MGKSWGVMILSTALAVTTFLPWAGVEARVKVLTAGLSTQTRGVETTEGIAVLVAALVALTLGWYGMRVLAALAGAAALVLTLLFLVNSTGSAPSLDLRVLEIGLVLHPAGTPPLGSSLVLVALALISRRSRADAAASDPAASPSPR